jgi:twitching motility protein PilT
MWFLRSFRRKHVGDPGNGLTMPQLFAAMETSGASDLHLKPGCTPGLRLDGQLAALDGMAPLDAAAVEALVAELATPEQMAELKARGDLEFACNDGERARYRVSLVCQRGTLGAVLRRIPLLVPDLDKLGLPPVVKRLASLPRGLVLVTGPTGSGKSTTLAAMVDWLNREAGGHVLAMEDPIEYVHRDQRCFITQREIGSDCESFDQALRRALRHDPDVIMIGELRDRETISLALTAAETGHLVLATVHTPGAIQTIDRVLDAFPSNERDDARGRLACCLQGVISQTLVPRIGGGRVAAAEVLVVTEAIRSCIREAKSHQIASQVQTGAAHGMQTQAVALAELVRRGMISEDAALAVAHSVEEVRHQVASGGSHLRATKPPPAPLVRRPVSSLATALSGAAAGAAAFPPTPPVEPVASLAPESASNGPAAASAASPPLHSQQQLLERLRRA